MAEISERGPIACTVAVTSEFRITLVVFFATSPVRNRWITRFLSLDMVPRRMVLIIGLVVTVGVGFFLFFPVFFPLTLTYVGTFWGEDGWFRIVRIHRVSCDTKTQTLFRSDALALSHTQKITTQRGTKAPHAVPFQRQAI